MQKFKYTAVNLQKEKFNGIFMAKDERDLATQLAKQNLYLIASQPYKGGTPSTFFSLGNGKVTISELNTFCRQYAIMINSGMSILACLDSLRGQSYTKLLKSILDVVYEDVKSGVMLSEAMNKHKAVFPDFFRSMIYVGEISGKLDLVFNSLADYYENDAKIKKKAKSALSYPLMLAGMTVGIVIAMMVFIVPTFRSSLSSLNLTAEGITKVVYDLSDFCLDNWKTILVSVILIAAVFFVIGLTEKGKFFYDKMKLKIPLVDKICLDLITARFARGFGLLLSSGMDIVDALESIEVVLGNREMLVRFKKATDDVRHGMSIAAAFGKYKLFPDLLTQMIAVGERTNALDDVLNRSCGFFDEQVETTITGITSKIQPVMLLMMGGIVGVLFIAIYSPMLTIMTGLGS